MLAQRYQKKKLSLQKDYDYNEIDGYFAWPTSFISVCNPIWKIVTWASVIVTYIYIYVWKLNQTVLELDF